MTAESVILQAENTSLLPTGFTMNRTGNEIMTHLEVMTD